MKRVAMVMCVVGLTVGAIKSVEVFAQSANDVLVIGSEPRPKPRLRPQQEGPEQPRETVPTQGRVQIIGKPAQVPVMIEGKAPVGAIMAWAKSVPNTPRLPGGWAECNGQELKDPGSPYNGSVLPNLNGVNNQPRRFLRGGGGSGATGGTQDHYHGASRSQKYGDSRKPVGGTGRAQHLPPYYEVVWIIRVK